MKKQDNWLFNLQILILYLKNNLKTLIIAKIIISINSILNNNSKITWIRQKYNIFLSYKTTIKFLSPIM